MKQRNRNELTSDIGHTSKIIEQHLINHWLYFKDTQDSKSVDTTHLKYISESPYCRVLFVNWLQKDEQYKRYEVEKIINSREQESEQVKWIVGPTSQPADIGKTLERMGFYHHEDWVGMEVNLLTKHIELSPREEFEFRMVKTPADLEKWVEVYVKGYQKPAESKEAIFNRFKPIVLHKQDEYRMYLGFYKGEPAVVGSLFFDKDVAGLYCIATAPEMRRKGLATVYLKNLLHVAKNHNATSCILHATESGKPAYEKLGFKSHCTFQVYHLGNNS
ncbi:ribosomal protein S18 acetylase RimI-like enzyme [Bacillus pakistanensis]|uniref:Ribosomal protein S18 acetylase RimI-like enzyme n=1 Tax=Rossellomorea pakistanensis TaxID=992288 RepID=A0ABS2N736_9BACI|nr:GNAT family N-acetyltransferase [Bacillus pakistanensis]MBM7583668.1 ribosomal protein S18 acetylase RimI-like enzyme [Bacillus pakistanensis]